MTDQDLAAYEALINAAAPGPWRRWQKNHVPAVVVDPDDISTGRIWTGPDADFIVASRTVAPSSSRR